MEIKTGEGSEKQLSVSVTEQDLKAKHCSCHYATVFLKCSFPKM